VRIALERSTDGLRCTAPSLTDGLAGSDAAVLGELEYLCTMRALSTSRRPAALHAALVSRPSAAALIVGVHAIGKTTLALAMLGAGCHVWGDDIAMVDAAGDAVALARPLRVRPPTLALLPEVGARIERAAVFDDEEEIYRIDASALDRVPPSVPTTRDVVFVHRSRRRAARVRPLASADAIPSALSHTFSTRPRDVQTAGAIVALLSRARAWRLDYAGSPKAAAAVLDEVLSSHAIRGPLSSAAR
jgi:hypothetical protein